MGFFFALSDHNVKHQMAQNVSASGAFEGKAAAAQKIICPKTVSADIY